MGRTTIGICDDELEICNATKKMILSLLTKLYGDDDEYFALKIYDSAAGLLHDIEEIDIAFLDVEMPVMDGMGAGNRIYKVNPNCKIIIATSNDKRYSEAFKFNAHRYLNKPLRESEVEEAIVSAINKTVGNSTLELFRNRIKYNVKQSDILYIKSFNGSVEVYTANNVFTKSVSLDQIENELDERIFYRIHRQYIVGFKNIKSVSKNIIELTNGEKLTISRRKLLSFEKAYIEYDLNFGG